MEKLLVLGSSFGSMEIVARAKERGIYTIVTDYLPVDESNAKPLADEVWGFSTNDLDPLEEKCRQAGVSGIISGVSQFNIEMSMHLCDRLGLPKYCTWDAWSYTRNKRAFKDVCKACGVHVAEDYYLKDYPTNDYSSMQYPVVVKPIDSGGNDGISYCYAPDEIIPAVEYARSVSDSDEIIIERFLSGEEYVGFYALADGEASLIDVWTMHHQEGEKTNIYSITTTEMPVVDRYVSECNEKIKQVFKNAGYTDGVAWVELILDQGKDFYVLETGYRLAGSMLQYTFKDICGFDVVDWMIDAALGISHSKEDLPADQGGSYDQCGCSYMLWASNDGVIKTIQGLEEIERKNAFVDFLRRPGFKMTRHKPLGEIIFTRKSIHEVIDMIKTINEQVHVINTDGENSYIRFTSFEKLTQTEKD